MVPIVNKQLMFFFPHLPLFLVGCAGIISQPQHNIPVEEPSAIFSENNVTGIANTQDNVRAREKILDSKQYVQGMPAVLTLLDRAENEKQSGKITLAAATLERAIRLEPKNPLLWSRLAEIRLLEKDWHQAYVLANKSNSLAQTMGGLQRQNWQIIERAKSAQGDMSAVEFARDKIKELLLTNP
jgi:tetratricopeptide (TPR) repeat protein